MKATASPRDRAAPGCRRKVSAPQSFISTRSNLLPDLLCTIFAPLACGDCPSDARTSFTLCPSAPIALRSRLWLKDLEMAKWSHSANRVRSQDRSALVDLDLNPVGMKRA